MKIRRDAFLILALALFIIATAVTWNLLIREPESLRGVREMREEVLIKGRLVDQIIQCESSCRHEGIWGDHHASYGLLQFKEPTFLMLAKKAGMKSADWKNKDDQIALLWWALTHGYGRYWTCYRKLRTE